MLYNKVYILNKIDSYFEEEKYENERFFILDFHSYRYLLNLNLLHRYTADFSFLTVNPLVIIDLSVYGTLYD